MLPFYNKPKRKIGIWTILKDSIGKDLSKMALPVYFNDPTSILQRVAGCVEYPDILDRAAEEPDPCMRLALTAIF